MILVRYAPLNMPQIGKGRWSWPLGLVNDEKLLNKISKIGQTTQRKIETNQQPSELNPQTEWEDIKIKIRQEAKKTSKEHMHKINTRIQLENDIKLTLHNDDIDTNKDTRSQKAWLESEINHLEKKRFKNLQLRSKAKWNTAGETISKYWCKINTPKKPRDIIYQLKIPNSNRLTSHSGKMAEIAKQYHESLQQENTHPAIQLRKHEAKQKTMNEIPNEQKLNKNDSPLIQLLEEHHIHEALYSSKSGSTAGIDGIPYEIWK